MLSLIKIALRISHNKLDDEILQTIEAGEKELVRLGVNPDKATDESDPLIIECIKAYCKSKFASDPTMAEGFDKSFKYQADSLRKSGEYRNV